MVADDEDAQPAPKTIAELSERLELHLNTISCDQQMFGTVLQIVLKHLIGGSQDKAKAFHRVRDEVLGAIDSAPGYAEDPQGGERRKQMTRMRAETFFQALGQLVGVVVKGPDLPTAN